MKFLSRLDDFESIIVDGNVQSSGLSSLYIKDSTNAILRIGNTTGDSFITYDGSELSISSDLDLRLTTPTDQDVFLITSSGNIVTTQGGGTFTIGGGLTLENFGAGYLKTDSNGVVSIDTDIIEDTLDSVTDRNAVTTNAITVGGLTVNSDGHQITVAQSDGSLVGRLSYTGTTLRIQGNDGIRFEDTNGSTIHGIITDAGLWGIGTTSPNVTLEANGIIRSDRAGVASQYVEIDGGNAAGPFITARGTAKVLTIQNNSTTSSDIYFDQAVASTYQFKQATVTKMILDASGNVGIGTASPSEKLDVLGNIKLGDGGTGAALKYNATNRGTILVNGSEIMRLEAAGNVGIGTTSPGAKLHVFNAGYPQVALQSNGGTWQLGVSTGNEFTIRRGTSGSNYPLWINDSDNVGIGTTSPIGKLNINGGTGDGATYDTIFSLTRTSSTGNQLTSKIVLDDKDTNWGKLIFKVKSTASAAEYDSYYTDAITIDNQTAKTGIGNSEPRERLDVDGNIVTTWGNDRFIGLQYQDGGNYRNGLLLHGDNRSTGVLAKGGSGSDPYIWFGGGVGSTSEWMRINKDGNVGIGTDNPSYILDTVGSPVRFTRDSKFIIINPNYGSSNINADIQTDADMALSFSPGGNERMRIASGGHVGIGTSNPTKHLHIQTSAKDTLLYLQSTNTTTDGYSQIQMQAGSRSAYMWVGNQNATAWGEGSFNIYTTDGVINFYTANNKRAVIDASGNLQLLAYTAGLLKTDASGNVSLDTTSYSTFSGDYGDLTNTPTIPVSGTDFDPVGTDNSTNVTLAGSYDYLTLSGQEITLGQVDYSTDISNTPTIPVSGTDFDPVGTDNSTNVTLATVSGNYLTISGQEITAGTVPVSLGGTGATTAADARTNLGVDAAGTDNSTNVTLAGSYDYLTLSGQEITLGQVDYDTDITNLPTLGTAASSAATDFVAVTGDTMTGGLNIEVSTSNAQLKLKRTTSATGEFNIYTNTDSLFFHNVGQSTYPMMINSSGNVGIGTTNPLGKLHIAQSNSGGVAAIYLSEDESTIQGPSGNTQIRMGSNLVLGGANIMTFGTSGSEQMRITGAGNVLIGTTTDSSQKLVVSGSSDTRIQIDATSTQGLYFTKSGANNGTFRVNADGDYEFYTKNVSQAVVIKADGNVGIGTTSPGTYKLNVNGTANFASNVAFGGYIDLTSTLYLRGNVNYLNAAGNGWNTFLARNGERFDAYVQNAYVNGVLTVGSTATFSNKVTLDADHDLIFQQPNSYSHGIVWKNTSYTKDSASIRPTGQGAWATQGIGFYTGNAGDSTTAPSLRFNIQAAGDSIFYNNVGIGTTSPSSKLTVQSGINTSSATVISLLQTTNGAEKEAAAFGLSIQNGGESTNAADLWFKTASGGSTSEKMRITSGGNVGIGTTNPATEMHLEGFNSKFTFTNTNTTSTGYQGIIFKSLDTTGVVNQSIGRIEFETSDTSSAGVGAYIESELTAAGGQMDLAFATGIGGAAEERMRITSAGNVGIGTDDPETKLHVLGGNTDTVGQIRVGGNAAQYVSGIDFYTGTSSRGFVGWRGVNSGSPYNAYGMYLLNYDNTPIIFGTSTGNEKMRINDNGNVGIGTTNPSAKLEIAGFSTGAGLKLNYGNSSGTIEVVNFIANGAANGVIGMQMVSAGVGDLWLGGSGGRSLTLYRDGNVGIGTTAPLALLSVGSGSLADSNLPIQIGTTGSTGEKYVGINKSGGYGLLLGYNENGAALAGVGAYVRQVTTDPLFFTVNNTTTAMTILSGGNVGIGTDSPNRTLTVNGVLGVASGITNVPELVLSADSNGTYISSTYKGTSSYVPLWLETNGSPRMAITTGGNVGIGTTSPTEKLHVVGTGRFDGVNVNVRAIDGTIITKVQSQTVGGTQGAIGTESNNDLAILTNNTARILVTAAGNVGIGTASPSTKLHVVGTAETRLRVGSSNASSNVVLELRDENSPTGQGTVITYNNATGETYFNNALSSATTDFHFQSGEYGSASDFFTLSNSGGNSIVQLSTTTGDSFITYEDATNELAIASDGDLRLTTPTDQDVFFISSGGNIDMTQAGGNVDMGGQLTVDGNGIFNSNVGIGTTSPATKLEVNEGVIRAKGTTSAVGQIDASPNFGAFRFYDGSTFRGGLGMGQWASVGANTDIIQYLNNVNYYISNGTTALLKVNTSGNVGIGATAPQQLLHIKGATSAYIMLEADSDTGTVGTYYKSEDTDDTMNRTKGFFGWQGQTGYGNGYFTMWLDTAEDNGTVTSSEEKFRWERDGDFHADGDVIAYSTTTPSDVRLKKDVTTIQNASEKVAKLRGVEYTWSVGKNEGKREIGLIAQEVEAVVPEVVTDRQLPLLTGTTEEYKTVDYDRLIALLIESNKELQNRITELESKVYGANK